MMMMTIMKKRMAHLKHIAIGLLGFAICMTFYGFIAIETTLSPSATKFLFPSYQQQWQQVIRIGGTHNPVIMTPPKLNSGSSSRRTPIVIIPGSMGSLVQAKLDKKATMRYVGNGKVKNVDGVSTRVPHYGGSMEGVNCVLKYTEGSCDATKNWKNVIEHLETKLGYQVGQDLFSAPYDFRRGPDDYLEFEYPNLENLVESVYELNGQEPVALVSIILGGLFVHTFLTHHVDQQWKSKYIKRWLSMSGLFNGFAQSFQNTFFGRNTFLGVRNFHQTDVRNAYRSWFSAAWLIPKDTYGDNRIILKTPHEEFRISDIKDIIHVDQADMYLRSFRYNVTADPGVPTDCWYSVGKRSPLAFWIQENMTKDAFYREEPVSVTKTVMGSGDDAADLKSLQLCERWKSATVKRFSICHGCYLYESTALRAIEQLFSTQKLLVEASANHQV